MNSNIIFKKISHEDIEFVNSIRNTYAKEYLHDSRLFSIEDTTEWLETTNPNYLMVYFDDIKIGYVRLSNYSKINNNLMVGMDIDPQFVNKGYGKLVYKILIPYLFEYYSLNKLSLEVLATNQRAINLYLKLGFKYEGMKRQEIYKDNVYIDSILMSILKSEL